MSRVLRPGPASMEGLSWLARVGPAPLNAWRCAMAWSEVAARSHARRLEDQGWLARYPMTRGQGSLFVATRTGIAVLGLGLRACGPPAPTWWAHHCGTAWTAAWFTARGRQILGARELLEKPAWSAPITWIDGKGMHTAGHRPDLVTILPSGHRAAVEVELAQKSAERLRAILSLHSLWLDQRTSAVMYVCGGQDSYDRVRHAARALGMTPEGRHIRIELLQTIRGQAITACEATRSARSGAGGGADPRAEAA